MDIGLGEEPGQSKDKIEEEYYYEVRVEMKLEQCLRAAHCFIKVGVTLLALFSVGFHYKLCLYSKFVLKAEVMKYTRSF